MLEKHPVFSKIFPLLPKDKFEALEADCVKRGIIQPLNGWEDSEGRKWCVDGYNRLTIAQKHGLVYETIMMKFENEAEVEKWIRLNQSNRRNLGAIANNLNIAEILTLNNGDEEETAEDCAVSVKTVQNSKKIKARTDMMPNQLVLDILTEVRPVTQKELFKLNVKDEDVFEEQIEHFRLGTCDTLKESIRRSKPMERGSLDEKDQTYIKSWALQKDSVIAYQESDKNTIKVNASNYLKRPEILEGIVNFWIKYPPSEDDHQAVWVLELIRIYKEFNTDAQELFKEDGEDKQDFTVFDAYYDYVLTPYSGPNTLTVINIMVKGFDFFQQFKRRYFMDAFQKALQHQINRLEKLKENPQFRLQYNKIPNRARQVLREEVYIPNKAS